jgi:hypothetical protein
VQLRFSHTLTGYITARVEGEGMQPGKTRHAKRFRCNVKIAYKFLEKRERVFTTSSLWRKVAPVKGNARSLHGL